MELLKIIPPQLLDRMLLPIRGLRHSKNIGSNKPQNFSPAKRTTLGPMRLSASGPGITWYMFAMEIYLFTTRIVCVYCGNFVFL